MFKKNCHPILLALFNWKIGPTIYSWSLCLRATFEVTGPYLSNSYPIRNDGGEMKKKTEQKQTGTDHHHCSPLFILPTVCFTALRQTARGV